tara:strand:+ start:415 stop:1125 length:711 start_codon:yes stop_codon:yes gene_type:complete
MNRLPDITVPYESEDENEEEIEIIENVPLTEPDDIFVRNSPIVTTTEFENSVELPEESQEPEEGQIEDIEDLKPILPPIANVSNVSPENPLWTCDCGQTLKMPTKYRVTKHLNSKGHKLRILTERTKDEQSKLDKQRQRDMLEEEAKLKTVEKEREDRYFKKFLKLQEKEKKVKEELRLKIMNDEIKKKVQEEEMEQLREKKYFEKFEKKRKDEQTKKILETKKEDTGYGIYDKYF